MIIKLFPLLDLIKEATDKSPTVAFYNDMSRPDYSPEKAFPVKTTFKIGGKSVEVILPIDINFDNIERDIDDYLKAPAELKKQMDVYAYWYDNFNKLIFENLPESDACLFLAAVAYCSANTALDQNILEASKLFHAVKHDFDIPNGREILFTVADKIDHNNTNKFVEQLKPFVDRGSAYAKLLTPKKDYSGEKIQTGPKKGQDDIFSEVTVSNAKIPNFNNFVKYYLEHNGTVTREELIKDFRNRRMDIGGTKIGSFFMNLIVPGLAWETDDPKHKKVMPATIDRWMIRAFFDKPLTEAIHDSLDRWVHAATEKKRAGVIPGKKDTEDTMVKKRQAIVDSEKKRIVEDVVMKLFSDDEVRKSLAYILAGQAQKIGLLSYQLQALSWVKIRIRYNEPAAKFARFEDVMDFAKEVGEEAGVKQAAFAATQIMKLDPNVNRIIDTLKILASGPRFKFKDKKIAAASILNRNEYSDVYRLPPKVEVVAKTQKKVSTDDSTWKNLRVALSQDSLSADIFDLGISQKTPIHTISGSGRKDVLNQSLDWVTLYNPA